MSPGKVPDILQQIVADKQLEVAVSRQAMPLSRLEESLTQLEAQPRGFVRALRASAESGKTAIIAEVKKGSPSKGVIRADFDPKAIAEIYARHGATCLSVLTDEKYFLGNLQYLQLIRETVSLPLLRKDFICDPYQIIEARVAGADAILLIAAMLDVPRIREFSSVARDLQLDILLEVHDERELEMALETDIELIGINNRNLRSFVTDLGTTERLLSKIPRERFVVSESGVHSRSDIDRLLDAGASAFLVGESLMREEDIGGKLDSLLGAI